MTSVSRLSVSISAHSWNKDKTLVAVSPNSSEINIYKRSGNTFTLEATLTDHDAVVTSIAWAPETNRILSCSQDRNAYVWNLEGSTWEPTLVILRINRAATECRWSPKEDKFAVASGDKCVAVCYYENDNDWWVSKHIKKELTSTIISVDWHPNNVLLATGGSDKIIRVYSGFIKGCDNRKDFADGTAFGKKLPFGKFVLASFPVGAWIHKVRWSPSGNQMAWSTHDSTIGILSCATEDHAVTPISHTLLPIRDICWVGEETILGVGFDCVPVLFKNEGGWAYKGKIDQKKKEAAGAISAMDKWKNRAATGKVSKADQLLPSRHQNSVSVLSVFDNGDFCTTGLDGNIILWSKSAQVTESGLSF